MARADVSGNDSGMSAAYSDFVALELVPKLRADYHAGAKPVITGSRFGGLRSVCYPVR